MDNAKFRNVTAISNKDLTKIEILKIIKEVLINEGIPLDSTYTGKGFWGMTEYIKKNIITGKKILFIHTGGTPLFFNDLEVLLNDWTIKYIDIKLWYKK